MTRDKCLFLSEAAVTLQVCMFLEAEGWTGVRCNPGKWTPYSRARNAVKVALLGSRRRAELPGKPLSLPAHSWFDAGHPDWIFVRSDQPAIYVEMKAEGKRPNAWQAAYLAQLRARGYRATWTDGLDTGAAPFKRFYEMSWD